jgi:hypothetical protein
MKRKLIIAFMLIAACFHVNSANAYFLRGDVNGDGVVDISDAVAALQHIFGETDQTSGCIDRIDANDDGARDIADPIYLLTYLFADGTPPPGPFPCVGIDHTVDAVADCSECPYDLNDFVAAINGELQGGLEILVDLCVEKNQLIDVLGCGCMLPEDCVAPFERYDGDLPFCGCPIIDVQTCTAGGSDYNFETCVCDAGSGCDANHENLCATLDGGTRTWDDATCLCDGCSMVAYSNCIVTDGDFNFDDCSCSSSNCGPGSDLEQQLCASLDGGNRSWDSDLCLCDGCRMADYSNCSGTFSFLTCTCDVAPPECNPLEAQLCGIVDGGTRTWDGSTCLCDGCSLVDYSNCIVLNGTFDFSSCSCL